MENKNGSGIFLGVVGVATLVVAIIGATFAFFTAQIEGGAGNAINAQSYQFATSMVVNEIAKDPAKATQKGLIPLNTAELATALVGATGKESCVDKAGYEACRVYKITFTNTADQAATLKGNLTVTTNGFTDHKLHFVELDSATTVSGTANSNHTIPTAGNFDFANTVTVPAKTGEISGTIDVYVAVYLENIDENQPNDQAKAFSGTLVFTSTVGGAQLKADFSA